MRTFYKTTLLYQYSVNPKLLDYKQLTVQMSQDKPQLTHNKKFASLRLCV